MAPPKKPSKSVLMAHPVSEAESDRRLIPVLDAIFKKSFKQALKLIQQALAKRPGWPAARALRACALVQSGRRIDALAEIDSLQFDLAEGCVPLDEDCARKMHMFYTEIEEEGKAADIYEKLWRTQVANFGLGEIAFCLYIRGREWAAAQKVATKMVRLSRGSRKYRMWAAVALWLHLQFDGGKDGRMAQLLCAMLTKALEEDLVPTAEMVRFCVRAFREAGKPGQALELLTNPRLVLSDGEILILRATVVEGSDAYADLIKQFDADGWEYWVKYLERVAHREDWEDEATAFIQSTIDEMKQEGQMKRGPFLAQLEVFYRTGKLEAVSNAVSNYFSLFGGRKVCAYDLRPYLSLLMHTECLEPTLEKLNDIVENKGEPYQLTYISLRTWLGVLDDTWTVEWLFERYQQLLVDDSKAPDGQLGDDYLLIAAHRLLPDVKGPDEDRYKDSRAVLQTIAILETGLTRSPSNYRFILLLLLLYVQVGAIERVAELWRILDVKHIQFSTLTHLVLRPFFDGGYHDDTHKVLVGASGLLRDNNQGVPECISKALQIGSINSAIENVLFRERLNRSAILAEAMIIEALHNIVCSEGEQFGVQGALACLTDQPRFTPESMLESKGLIADDDVMCYQFWEVESYNPKSRLECTFEEDSDRGTDCPTPRATVIAADLYSLHVLLQLSVQKNDMLLSGKDTSALLDQLRSFVSDCTEREFPEMIWLRMKITLNLNDVKLLAMGSHSPQHAEPQKLDAEYAKNVLSSAREWVQNLKSIARAVVDNCDSSGNGFAYDEHRTAEQSNENNKKRLFSPQQLKRCSKLVFDSLLLTCVTIVSLSPLFMKGKKRAKKSSKSNDGPQTVDMVCFEYAKTAIREIRAMVLDVSSLLETWIMDACADDNLDWVESVFSEQSFSDAVSFLPARINTLIQSSDELESRDRMEVQQTEFLAGIANQVWSSHIYTSRNTLKVLRNIVNQMTMVDL